MVLDGNGAITGTVPSSAVDVDHDQLHRLPHIYRKRYIVDVRPDLDLIAEPTRRLVLAIIAVERELCVCELVAALAECQPAVSRHLALLREGGWVVHRREGTYVHYRLAALPPWARQIVDALAAGGAHPGAMRTARRRLHAFAGRPSRRMEAA